MAPYNFEPSVLVHVGTSEPMAGVARATDPGFALVPNQSKYDGVYYYDATYAIARDSSPEAPSTRSSTGPGSRPLSVMLVALSTIARESMKIGWSARNPLAPLTVMLVAPVLGFADIYRKLEVANRTEAAHYAYEHGLIDNPQVEH